MQVFPYELEYYVTENGRMPFKEWLDARKDYAARAKIRIRLDYVRLGNLGDCHSVADGVQELRIKFGPGYRVYFAHERNRIILLLIGGDKKTQRKDIEKAKNFLSDHKNRRKHHD
jgi:putative addiction module killer protein